MRKADLCSPVGEPLPSEGGKGRDVDAAGHALVLGRLLNHPQYSKLCAGSLARACGSRHKAIVIRIVQRSKDLFSHSPTISSNVGKCTTIYTEVPSDALQLFRGRTG